MDDDTRHISPEELEACLRQAPPREDSAEERQSREEDRIRDAALLRAIEHLIEARNEPPEEAAASALLAADLCVSYAHVELGREPCLARRHGDTFKLHLHLLSILKEFQ